MGTRLTVATGALTVGLAAMTGLVWSSGSWSPDEDPGGVRVAGVLGDGAGPVNGAALFQVKGCATCHDGPDGRAAISVGPSLAEAAVWAGTRRPGMSAAEYLQESMRDPSAFLSTELDPNGPVASMPDLALSAAEIDALVTYLLHD